MQSKTAQAQLAEAQRMQWTQLAQMARPPIGMNGLSNAMGMDAPPSRSSNYIQSALDMSGLGQGRNSVPSPMAQFDAYSPASMAPSPFFMSDAHEIVPLPAEVAEDAASRFTEVDESPNGKTASQLPMPSSPVRPYVPTVQVQTALGGIPNDADSGKVSEPLLGPTNIVWSAKPVTTSGLAASIPQASTTSQGISNDPPQSIRSSNSNGQPQSVHPQVTRRPPIVTSIPAAVFGRSDPSPAVAVLPEQANVAPAWRNDETQGLEHPAHDVPPVPATADDVPSRVRPRSESDEEAAGERHTKRRRTDQVRPWSIPCNQDTHSIVVVSSKQSRCIPPQAHAPVSAPRSVEPLNGMGVQDGKPSWNCASDTSDTETVAPLRVAELAPSGPAETVSTQPAASSASTVSPSASQTSKASSVRQTLEKVFDKNPHPSDAVFAKLASALKIEDVEPVKKLFALWRQNGHKPSVEGA